MQEKMKFQDAHNFCLNICTQLYVPDNFDTTYHGLALNGYDDDIDVIHIGLKVDNDKIEGVKFYYLNGDELLSNSKIVEDFTDVSFFRALLFRKSGMYSLALDSTSRYNMWQTTNHNAEHYFACQSTTLPNKCYEYGTMYEPNDKVISEVIKIHICEDHCNNDMSCNYWSHDGNTYNCYLRDDFGIPIKNSSVVSGSKTCLVEKTKSSSKEHNSKPN